MVFIKNLKNVKKKHKNLIIFLWGVVNLQQKIMFNFSEYQKIKQKIQYLSNKTQIIAISKNHPLEVVENAILCGLQVFGENRVQEAKSKFEDIKSLKINWTWKKLH